MLFPNQLQIAQFLEVQSSVISFPEKILVPPVMYLRHFRGVVFNSPNPATRATVNFAQCSSDVSRGDMDQYSRGKYEIKLAVAEGDIKCGTLFQNSSGDPVGGNF